MPAIRPRRAVRAVLLTSALLAGLTAAGAAPAQAKTAAVATMSGTGTIAPGLTSTGLNYQNFTFTTVTFQMTGVTHESNDVVILGSSSCTANGASIVPENQAFGAGAGNWSCSTGVMAGKGGQLTYVRSGGEVVVATSGGLRAVFECIFQADQTPPATIVSYHLTCAGAGKHAIPGATDPDPTD